MKQIKLSPDDELLNPCWDNVFKAIFTKETPESRGALRGLLSAVIGRDVQVIAITANEPPISNIRDRQIRFDISVKLDGELSNIEMTMHPRSFEHLRLEYYVARFFVSQDIRGVDKGYDNLDKTYQIALINDSIFPDQSFIHTFEYYDREHDISLNGQTRIITVELSKLEETVQKPAETMSVAEKWAVFFRYCLDKERRGLINTLIKDEEGITMASEVLLSVSKDEIERARLLSEYKFEVDLQSDRVYARREGKKEGMKEKAFEIARNFKSLGLAPDQIAAGTGLPLETVENL
jgi:predicted transposase/invertase (TIGR01784 family)